MGTSIENLRRGDAEAWRALIQQLSEELLGYAYSIVGDWATAQDVVQEALLALYQSRRQLRADSRLKGWCFRAVRNRARNHNRDAALRTAREQEAADMSDQTGQSDQSFELWQATETLPDDEREIIELRYRHGLMLSEVAEVLAIPEGTVSTRQRRGLENLREHLQLSAAPAVIGLLESGAKLPSVPSEIVQTLEVVFMASIAKKSLSLVFAFILIFVLVGCGASWVYVQYFASGTGEGGSSHTVWQPIATTPEVPNGEPIAEADARDPEATDGTEPDRQPTEDNTVEEPTTPIVPAEIDFDSLTLTVSGCVTNEDGEPLTNREVELLNDPFRSIVFGAEVTRHYGHTQSSRVYAITTTGMDGRYTMTVQLRDYRPEQTDASSVEMVARVPGAATAEAIQPVSAEIGTGATKILLPDVDLIVTTPYEVTCTVADESGLPVEGASCCLMDAVTHGLHYAMDGSWQHKLTDADGVADIAVARPNGGDYTQKVYVVVDAPGFAVRRSSELHLIPQMPGAVFTVTLLRESSVEARLMDQNGDWLSNVAAKASFRYENVRDADWHPILPSDMSILSTGLLGEVRLPSIPAADVEIKFEVEGYTPAVMRVGAGYEQRVGIVFKLQRRSQVRFTYTATGTDSSFLVGGYRLKGIQDPVTLERTTLTTAAAQLEFTDLDLGRYELTVWFGETMANYFVHTFELQPAELLSEQISIEPLGCTAVGGRVVLGDGSPSVDATVKLWNGPKGNGTPLTTQTNSNGEFLFEYLERSEFTVWADTNPTWDAKVAVDTTSGADALDVQLILENISWLEITFPAGIGSGFQALVTYGDGQYTITWPRDGVAICGIISGGEVAVRLTHYSWRSEPYAGDEHVIKFDAQPGETHRVSFVDQTYGSLSGTLNTPAGPAVDREVKLVRVGPETTLSDLAFEGHYHGFDGGTATSENGSWEVNGLAPGRYLVLVQIDHEWVQIDELNLRAAVNPPVHYEIEK